MTRPGGTWRNWARTEKIRPQSVERPRTVEAVRRAVDAARRRGLRVKAVGAGHSFTGIALAPGVLLDLTDLTGLVSVDPETRSVRLLAGTRLHQIPGLLRPYGLAMENLGDIDHQSIAGALATGTHGTGARFGGLATQVIGLTLVTASGDLVTISESENAELLPAGALSLGALGIVVDVTLRCVPAFGLAAQEKPERLTEVVDGFAERAVASDHFEFFWFPHTDLALTKTNRRLDVGESLRPLSRAARLTDDLVISGLVHPMACGVGTVVPALVPAINRMSSRVWGNRSFSDQSTRVFTSVRHVRFREMEYALPVAQLPEAFHAVQCLIEERRWRIEFPIEVRVAAADDVWMSTAYGRDTGYLAIHRYWRKRPDEYFRAVEEIMRSFGGRPHWGKMHSADAQTLRELYPRFDEFLAVRERLDPDRAFRNAYLDRVLGP